MYCTTKSLDNLQINNFFYESLNATFFSLLTVYNT